VARTNLFRLACICRHAHRRAGPKVSFSSLTASTHFMTGNLHAALEQLRHKIQPRNLWIDAICINQSDPIEKNHQVGQMFEIYCSASIVWICSGEADADTDIFFGEFLENGMSTTVLSKP
jgi:hypothetical protein